MIKNKKQPKPEPWFVVGDVSLSSARRTPSGRCLPLEEAMVDMSFMASVTLPRMRYHLGDSEIKGRTRMMQRKEGMEEAMYRQRHVWKMQAMPERSAMPPEKKQKVDIPAVPRLVGPIGSVARTKAVRPTPPLLKPVRRRRRTQIQQFGDRAVKQPKMVFRAQTTVREPFLPKEESERWPNVPAPEIIMSKQQCVVMFH